MLITLLGICRCRYDESPVPRKPAPAPLSADKEVAGIFQSEGTGNQSSFRPTAVVQEPLVFESEFDEAQENGQTSPKDMIRQSMRSASWSNSRSSDNQESLM